MSKGQRATTDDENGWYEAFWRMAGDVMSGGHSDEESRPIKTIGGRCPKCKGKYYVDARDPDGCDCD